MIAVIFEVEPRGDAERADYLDIAAAMRSLVEEIDGFISVERFQSLTNPGKMLSLSFFRDEAAIDDEAKRTAKVAPVPVATPMPSGASAEGAPLLHAWKISLK